MHTRLAILLSALVMLTSCSSPPKPPTVDPSDRHPANTGAEVSLQACKNDLRNTQIQSREAGRQAASASATLDALVARQKMLAVLREMEPRSTASNSIYTVRFDYGSSRVDIPEAAAHALIVQAKASPLVLLRGRTDGVSDSLVESRIARERAAAVRDYLVNAGVDPARIRATFQPSGDQVADNTSPAGKSLNRRVEIELYRALPIALNAESATP